MITVNTSGVMVSILRVLAQIFYVVILLIFQIRKKEFDSNLEGLQRLRKTDHNNPMIGYLNINSLRNKINSLREITQK